MVTEHRRLFRFLGLAAGVLGLFLIHEALALIAVGWIAWLLLRRRMGLAMRRIASGDFSQPLQVENRDELGELANRINSTAQELAGFRRRSWPKSGPAASGTAAPE